MSDSYCKGCRDEPGGCERCNPAREERERQWKRAETEQRVLDAMGRAGQSTLLSYQQTPGWLGDACRAELARRGLK